MRIAQLAPPWIRVPPDTYGGIEWVVALLADELVRLGHEVTLFASGDSDTKAMLRYVFEVGQTEKMGMTLPDAMQVSNAFRDASQFDLIHDHSGFLGVAFASLVDTPVLHTLHGSFTEDLKFFYSRFADSCYYNAISDYQRLCFPHMRYVGTVHNAIDVHRYPFRSDKEDFALLVSRVTPDKGTHLAVEIAKRAGVKLVLAGKIDEGADRAYFEEMVEPHVDGDKIRFLGEVSEARKRELMAAAFCFLFPIQWSEPFGLVMAEAMAGGTPVIAMRNGASPEVVADGVTGFVAEDLDEMVARVGDVAEIDPRVCRNHVEANFSPARMASGYVHNYETILELEKAPPVPLNVKGGGSDDLSLQSRPPRTSRGDGKASGGNGDRERHRRYDMSDSPKSR